ncbi:hypothetical protein BLA29_009504 [Euroglyphus maynei]|uniref:Uncharacterized protein n=1 Tax=Euroglyphus maynei TaxID=6958 RepID=A0A1Y3BH11_EURMA|nr:hypothetical protein BLA29_009504 [Euroglyphus maynei]
MQQITQTMNEMIKIEKEKLQSIRKQTSQNDDSDQCKKNKKKKMTTETDENQNDGICVKATKKTRSKKKLNEVELKQSPRTTRRTTTVQSKRGRKKC